VKKVLLFLLCLFPFSLHGLFIVRDEPGLQLYSTIGFDGTHFFFIWSDIRYPLKPQLYASRVTQSGVVLDTNGIPVDTSLGYQLNSSVSFRYPYFLAVWTDDVSGRRVQEILLSPISAVKKSSHTGQSSLYGAEAIWDETDSGGKRVSAGIYFCVFNKGKRCV
jgi:hypothetical protein